jgi:hypothetical protein
MATVQSVLAVMQESRRLATAEQLPGILCRAALPDILSGAFFNANLPHSEASAAC